MCVAVGPFALRFVLGVTNLIVVCEQEIWRLRTQYWLRKAEWWWPEAKPQVARELRAVTRILLVRTRAISFFLFLLWRAPSPRFCGAAGMQALTEFWPHCLLFFAVLAELRDAFFSSCLPRSALCVYVMVWFVFSLFLSFCADFLSPLRLAFRALLSPLLLSFLAIFAHSLSLFHFFFLFRSLSP